MNIMAQCIILKGKDLTPVALIGAKSYSKTTGIVDKLRTYIAFYHPNDSLITIFNQMISANHLFNYLNK